MDKNVTNKKKGISRLLELSGQRKTELTGAIIFGVLHGVLSLAPFLLIYHFFDELFSHSFSYDAVVRTIIYVLVVVLVSYGCHFLSGMLAHRAAFHILYGLRKKMAQKAGRLPLGYLGKKSSGALQKTIVNDIEHIELFIAHLLPDTVKGFCVPLVTLAYLFWQDWRLALISLLPLLILTVWMTIVYADKEYKKKTAYYFEARSRMNSVIIEYVRAIPVMKIFGKGTEQFALYREAVEELVDFGKKWAYQSLRSWAVFMSFLSNAVLPVLILGIYLYLHQGLSAGVFVLFLVLGGAYIKPLFGLSNLTTELMQINTGVEKMDEFLDAPEQELQGKALQPAHYSVTFHDVTFSYGTTVNALDGASFEIPHASITAFVGPSGSGKSTAAQMVARFWDVDSGSVLIGGVDCRQIPTDELMGIVSFVFQDSFMFQETLFENIRMGMDRTEQEIIGAAKAARCHDFIMKLPDGYQTRWGEQGTHLSGGEQQRIQIARAILKNAPILVLDEATAFADPENEYQIQQAIGELIHGKTVIIIAHRLSTITDADQILVFDKGSIVASGKHHQLLESSELYNRMWDAHIQSKDFKLINE